MPDKRTGVPSPMNGTSLGSLLTELLDLAHKSAEADALVCWDVAYSFRRADELVCHGVPQFIPTGEVQITLSVTLWNEPGEPS